MASVNRVILIGNLGQDPEVRSTAGGTAVCTLSLATTDVRNDKDGNRQETTEWHRVVVWGKQAENCGKYLSKGRPIYVEGRLQTRSWDDRNSGQKRYTTEIVAQNVQFLGSGGQRDQGAGASGGYQANTPSQDQGFDAGMGDMGRDFGGPQTPSLDDIPF